MKIKKIVDVLKKTRSDARILIVENMAVANLFVEKNKIYYNT